MMKYNFKDDYSEGCHPHILEMLSRTNFEQQDAYGDDKYSRKAKQIIKEKLRHKPADIFFVSGGTQANLIIISSILKPHESVIAAHTGHVNTYEAGAIEATGHKINAIESLDGKINPENIQTVLDKHNIIPHMVKPKMVYISNSTEIGSIYKKSELLALSEFCQNNNLFLFMDGARLGTALSAKENDLSLSDIAKLTDVFYIGGTKNGALIGEAIVISNKKLQEDFGYQLKQKGALLSKGRLLGIQFLELFKDDLFFDLAQHANQMALKLVQDIQNLGYTFLIKPETNQIFPVFPNKLINRLEKKYGFHIWKKTDQNHSAIRLVTSWATKETAINEFLLDLEKLS